MRKPWTTADRFNLFLDWINDDDWLGVDDGLDDDAVVADGVRDDQLMDEVHYRLGRFIESFDGSENAGFLRA
ncbi:MAG: hypothetical protein Q7J25_10725, partial [Vicinamibacterales bacterium]|nr:hypothetical protein [Vicinamibacterales bacterium]